MEGTAFKRSRIILFSNRSTGKIFETWFLRIGLQYTNITKIKGPTDTSNFDDFEENDPWIPHFTKNKDGKAKAKQDLRFVGFTFKKSADDAKIKNIVSLFEEIEQARDQKKKLEKIEMPDEKPEEKKLHWMHRIPGAFPGTPKSPIGHFQPTLMVSPRKENSVKLPISIKSSQQKPITPQPTIQLEIQKKTSEGKTDAGKMLYYGPYSSKGFQRSSSNEPYSLKPKTFNETMGSPKKQEVLSTRKSPGISDSRKNNDLLSNNIMVSPTGQASSKKKGFGFLGLKFLGKKS